MAVLLWICGLAVTSLFLAAWREGRGEAPDRWWSYQVQPAVAVADPGPDPLMRPSPRPALQTGAVILAVALAIDLSAAPLAQFAPAEPQPVSLAAAAAVYDFTSGHDPYAAYAPATWAVSGGASDGWFV